MKLSLGTVQFGMDYGINNPRGKIPKEEVFEILEEAEKNGIDTLDTAYAYGDSEKVIGEYLKNTKSHLKVISKLPPCEVEKTEAFFHTSLQNLQTDSIYGYLLHDFGKYPENVKKLEVLGNLKAGNKIQKIGFSLYYPKELEYLIENKISIDIIQIPHNLFDQRFSIYFPLLKEAGIEIHVRSVFLQGLFFKNPQELKGNLTRAREKLLSLRALSKETNIPVEALSLNFAVLNNFVDRVIIGIDTIANLRDNVKALQYQGKIEEIYDRLVQLKEDDENIIVPVNWKR